MKATREETEEQMHRITVLLCNAIIEFNSVNVMPTVNSIEKMFLFAIGLFLLELVFHLLHIYTFISVYGAGINLVLLTVLMLKEKHDDNVITKSYVQVQKRIKKELNKNGTRRKKKKAKR